ncbi:IgGFc-binding protein-like [Mauremys mutica]|uniref:IgGFc-binding protein-like n=1 Tax=Mauremys mutica TaxID=74926 RepID=UPI001D16C5FE|nr:IgGFc-binding protein-like [Mauremys mutica]
MAMKGTLLLCAWLVLLCGLCRASFRGKEFITVFMQNYVQSIGADCKLFITGYHASTTVTVTVNKGTFRRVTPVGEGQTVTVQIPASVEMFGSQTFDSTILIQADKDISVLSVNSKPNSIATTVVYPTEKLGTVYYIVTPPGKYTDQYKEFAVVAGQAPTTVDIYLKGAVLFKQENYAAGRKLTVTLAPYQALQLQSSADLSGTKIESREHVAVLTGHSCAAQNTPCDHAFEQLLPVSSWGSTYIVPPLSFQDKFDITYIVASQNTRIDYQSGPTQASRNILAGQVVEFEVRVSHPLYISASAGIQVLLFFTGAKNGISTYDPFLINIPPVTNYCHSYHIDGVKDFESHVLIVVKSSESSRITSDQRAIGNVLWRQIPGTEYSWGEYSFGIGISAHSIEHPSSPFGLLSFGGNDYGGYGSSGLCAHILPCPENSHYEACGNACPASCSDRTAPSSCREPCVETCQCDNGYVLSAGQCVPVGSCGCDYNGRYYKPNKEFWDDENCRSRCRCDPSLGLVVCQETTCKANERCAVINGVRDCHAISYSTCTASGDPHYTTFDGKKYDFMGTCIYQLAGVCSEDPTLTPFNIKVENNNHGSKAVSYTKAVTLEVYGRNITVSQQYPRKIKVDGVFMDLPFYHEEKLQAYVSGSHIAIKTAFALTVTFDWSGLVRVTVPNTYTNALCGLCGNNNQTASDDLTMRDGSRAANAIQFAESWKVGEVPGCLPSCTKDCPVCSEAQRQPYKGDGYCGVITRGDGPFRECHEVIDPAPFFDDCVFDTCQYKGHRDALCSAISAYVTACQAKGIQIGQWRSASFCSATCPHNSHYELCGNSCPATCHGLSAPDGCDAPCAEGCFCDAGFLLSGDRCVPVVQCGCVHQGRYYRKGEEFYTSASCQERCRCKDSGVVECREASCGANEQCRVENGILGCHAMGCGKCVVSGNRHYLTFDGRAFDFQGTCTYSLARVCSSDAGLVNFSVVVENESYGNGQVSVARLVVVSVHGYTVTMERGRKWKVTVDGELYTLPLAMDDGKLWINQEGNNIIVQSAFGLRVLYDTSYYVLVSIPSSYKGHVCGLCSNFNGDKNDDFLLPSGKSTQNADEFGASWKVPVDGATCTDGCGERCPVCDEAQTKPYQADSSCGLIKATSGPFKYCHSLVSLTEYFNHCLYDMCAANGAREILCQSVQAYVCQASWRHSQCLENSLLLPFHLPSQQPLRAVH